ncbi:hypothetical protein INT44_002653 [Umbelopsis vinacea]|uniref:Uncharacterized protein n=1 Tax=Umbelopsis vinacea TaxID=44442 RepID=A0A8H7PEV8_9FUNG|nr:hypothetical protein INT44_002653 [Umbelopsis vinacea]
MDQLPMVTTSDKGAPRAKAKSDAMERTENLSGPTEENGPCQLSELMTIVGISIALVDRETLVRSDPLSISLQKESFQFGFVQGEGAEGTLRTVCISGSSSIGGAAAIADNRGNHMADGRWELSRFHGGFINGFRKGCHGIDRASVSNAIESSFLAHSTGEGSSCDRRTDRRRVDRTSLE